ncbi:LOW QUALITY PROTEIN: hypothetical protein U9M48_012246 [Paspalum notatum var. saurae]|uniref:Uncharacterized protein n=1 Tax=Paspalum notatum var. saurae TaxID=547442 RepID=A0AAQ3SZI3_PASNO
MGTSMSSATVPDNGPMLMASVGSNNRANLAILYAEWGEERVAVGVEDEAIVVDAEDGTLDPNHDGAIGVGDGEVAFPEAHHLLLHRELHHGAQKCAATTGAGAMTPPVGSGGGGAGRCGCGAAIGDRLALVCVWLLGVCRL